MSGDSSIEHLLERAVTAMGGAHREGQVRMAVAVRDALESKQHALIQAGTGTGKSVGYLVPAVAYAARHQARVVISTATLALQRQVMTKDLPLVLTSLADHLPDVPRVALLKGRSNYLCKHRLGGGYPEPDEDMLPVFTATSDLGKEVARLHEWSGSTTTGDRDDLVPGVSNRAWSQVSVTGVECLGTKCPMVDECFSEAARDAARTAHIIVTNHAVLGVQATGTDLLGEYDAVIVDEAHELVPRITSAATHELSVSRIDSAGRSARRCGVTTDDLDRAGRALDAALESRGAGRIVGHMGEDLELALALVRDAARDTASAVGRAAKEAGAAAQIATARLLEIYEVCEQVLAAPQRYVIWLAALERDDARDTPSRLLAAPLDVAGLIASAVIGDAGAVMTSATLTVLGSFDPMARHLGIDQPEAIDVGSPFAYETAGILYVAAHLPKPVMSGISDQALDELADLIEAAGGRTLGLFSSHRAAEAATAAMRERLDVPIINQRDDQASTVIAQFVADPQACLFGAATLWQGIDVPGPSLSLVVIDRIPFPRPDEPITQARSEAVAARGGNGFMAVSATQAALMMAQGAGRLIRTHRDRGVVAILDSRVATSGYGAFLVSSLPPLWRTTDREVVLAALRRLNDSAHETLQTAQD